MDKSREMVDKIPGADPEGRSPSTAWHRLAQTLDSTRSVRSGRGSPRAASVPSSVPIDGRIPERVLLRGYGLDPDDLELERIKRP